MRRSLVIILIVAACGNPSGSAGLVTPSTLPYVGRVEFLSSQGATPEETSGMNGRVLTDFNGQAVFMSDFTGTQDIARIEAEQKTGMGTVDVLALAHGEFSGVTSDALTDLTPLLRQLEKSRQFPQALLDYGRFGTNKQYYIPWLQATYMMAANKRALPYLPKGADVNNLTYDELIAWGQALQKATGKPEIGIPASPGLLRGGSLIHRFLQGYIYPSYTGAGATKFRSPEAVQAWKEMRRLWAVTNPQSTTYDQLQDPLLSGDVLLGWDHQARIQGALQQDPNQFIVFPAPRGPKGLGYISVVVGLAIPKTAPNSSGAAALIDYLTRPSAQITASGAIGFFPTVKGVRLTGLGAPGYLQTEAQVAAGYTSASGTVVAISPIGLGADSDAFSLVYQEAFARIILQNEDIQTVLDQDAAKLQTLITHAGAQCWPPDPPSIGICQIK